MLTERQKLTIKRLRDIKGISDPLEIIKWAAETMTHPRGKLAQRLGVTRRRHPRRYFQEIINHFAQGNNGTSK